MHLNFTGEPDESEESQIFTKDDCFVDGENILSEYRKNKFTFSPEKKTKNIIFEKSVVLDPKQKLMTGMWKFSYLLELQKY